METYRRFIEYAKIHTTSSEESETTPTAAREFDLSRYLEKEMKEIGLQNVSSDEHAYVYGFLPASEGLENRPCVAFIAHIDTAPDFSGENVKPQLVENYDGGIVALGTSGRVLDPGQFPHLKKMVGETLITTDGTTLLGADDKAGIAESLTAAERIIEGKIPHGPVAFCFTPDEEVGHGAALLDLEKLGAEFAYTVDGDAVDEINYETFNAAAALFEVSGFNIHPGEAKNKMINASIVACEINAMLPAGDRPEHTEGREGFYHLTSMEGNVEKARICYIIRDHSAAAFEHRLYTLEHIAALINEKYGEGTVRLTIQRQYRNMAEKLADRMDIVKYAEDAVRKAGFTPVENPVRGGTDGSQLSFRGLPCPNIGTGGHCYHGPYEHISVEGLEKGTEIIMNIIEGIAE